MTVMDTGMVIVAIGNIAAVTGATPTATTTLHPSSNSSSDNNKEPPRLGQRLIASLKCFQHFDPEQAAVFTVPEVQAGGSVGARCSPPEKRGQWLKTCITHRLQGASVYFRALR